MLQYIVFSVLLIVGILIVLIQEKLGSSNWAYPYLSQIASALLVGGTLSLLFKIFVDRDSYKKLTELFRIHDSIIRSGLKELHMDSKSYNYSDLIENSKEFTAVLNDGLRWVGKYSVVLGKRFGEKTTTEFFLVNENGPFVAILASKVGTKEDSLKEKLRQSKKLIIDTYESSGKKGVLKIYAMKNFPTHAVFRGEEHVVLTPYQISSGRRSVPLYVYEKQHGDSVAGDVIGDLEFLRTESECVYDSTKNP